MSSTLPATQGKAANAIATYDYGDSAGAGFDNQTNEDVSIPFLGVLQSNSPQVASRENRIEGARPGDLINTVTNEVFDGGKGVYFQPSDTSHVFVEWKPRDAGGGFVAIHALDSPVVAQAKKESTVFGKYKTPAGNDLIETFYITGMIHRSLNIDEQAAGSIEPAVIAFSSTKIKVYKSIMTRLRTFQNGKPPLFAHRLIITTSGEKNDRGEFYNFSVKPAVNNDLAQSLIPPTLGDGSPNPLLLAGQELLKANRRGDTKVKHDTQNAGEGKKDEKGDDIPF
jgi:hypothetical protein